MRSFFQFKQFKLNDNCCGMKLTTDAVLLGSWTHIYKSGSILDIGTGSGVLALMLAQRYPNTIDAIDIDPTAIETASENVKISPWHDRINTYNISLKDYVGQTKVRYSHIICNPPYFQNSLTSLKQQEKIAKHALKLSYAELLFYSSIIIEPMGYMSVIIPFTEKKTFIDLAIINHLKPLKITDVADRPSNKKIRTLILFQNNTKISTFSTDILYLKNTDGTFSEAYKILAKPYLLNF